MLTVFAPAKINLYLHVTGRRADGYHNLDSLVAFTGVGDLVRLESADVFSFHVEGPLAAVLSNEDPENNLVVRAARALADLTGQLLNVRLTLVKNLPVASGIGGGSSDAAAALRALAQHWGLHPDDPRVQQAAAAQGQDVPVCLKIENNYMTAGGTESACALPQMGVVLANPNKPVPTPAVYKTFREGGYAFTPAAQLDKAPANAAEFIAALRARTNDLYAPALLLLPEIGPVIDTLAATPNCLLSRMSGSGATCFGLYPDEAAAQLAAAQLKQSHPHWWIAASTLPLKP